MSYWDFFATWRQNYHHQVRRLGDGGIRAGTRAAAGRLAEAGAPIIVSLLAVDDRLPPHDVIGGINDAEVASVFIDWNIEEVLR